MLRLVAKLVVCVFNQVSEVIDDLWGKRNISINLRALQHHCSTSTLLLEAPKWEPAAPCYFPVRQTSDPHALKGPNPGKHYTRDFNFRVSAILHCNSGGKNYSLKQQDQPR